MKTNRNAARSRAFSRQTARADRHAETMMHHARYRANVNAYAMAYDAWLADGCTGPRPIDPRNVSAGI